MIWLLLRGAGCRQVTDRVTLIEKCAANARRAQMDSIWAVPRAVPAAGEQTGLVQTSYGLVPIGWVQSALRVLDDATVGWTDRRSVCG